MPVVRRPAVLKAVYHETTRKIGAWELPNELIQPERTFFRFLDAHRVFFRQNDVISKNIANEQLQIRELTDRNRFSGSSFDPAITSCGGLYCSSQHLALVNEIRHYSGTFAGKCVFKIRLMGSFLAADLSPHNPGARKFIEELGKSPSVQDAYHSTGGLAVTIWKDLLDGEDCSVARGIGLAVANSGKFRALQALSVRSSGRPGGETGDNIVFFGHYGQIPQGLYIEEAYLFPINSKPQVYPVEFP